MDDLNLDADDLMDLDDHDGGSDLDEEDEDVIDDPSPSPLQLPSSGPASTATSVASSPPANDEIIAPIFNYSGKPMSIKRGRGRPRRDAGGKPIARKFALGSGAGGMRMKRWKPGGIGCGTMRGVLKRPKSFDRGDFEFAAGILQSSANEEMILDAETGALVSVDRPSSMQQPVPEDPPFCPEQWPGKVCGFCNLSERSQLGQGDMLRLTCPLDFRPQRSSPAPSGASVGSSPTTNIATTPTSTTPTCTLATNSVSNIVASVAAGDGVKPGQITVVTGNSGVGTPCDQGDKSPRGPVTCRRQKSFHKSRNPSVTNEYIDELAIIGYTEEPDIQMVFDSSGYFYVHRSCALWSQNVEITENQGLENVGQALFESCSRKCAHCNHYGASASCKVVDCTKVFHYPCATAAAAFQELSSRLLFCSLHLGEVRIACENSVCYTCKLQGDMSNLMYCSLCGVHYHGTCVGLAQLPGVRAGWQCRKCKICQVCRMAGDETKLMSCEQCDKVYHAMCQRPIATSIPKYGWKCRCCRVCGDCGSRTPGAGLSSRWHAHYTVCDSCYQQRNKGFCCPICHRAYRAHAHREMVQCTVCRKFVHGTCDLEADLLTYAQRKESHPEYDYVCALCKGIAQSGRHLIAKRNSIDEDSMSASQESLYDDMSEFDTIYPEDHMRTIGLGKGKPYSACKIAKKRLGMHSGLPGRPKGVGKGMGGGGGGPGCVAGKVGFMKRQRMTEFGRKRGTKYKMRGMFGVPGVGLQKPVGDSKSAAEEEPGIENKMILCSAKDKFVLTQDLCVMCGAIGTDQEGCLIACVQCGQCYHPYCVNVKVTKIILQKGWRCLDCTVCEGCGQRNDESRLILCDDCDISYHIYCMEPPLDYVPHGNWKCRWCAQCQRCGSTDPGFNCTWMNSFNECGPCASHSNCPICMEGYSDGELILQCVQCERWLHGICDSIKNDSEAERCAEEGYNCVLCRPRDVPPPHLLPLPVSKPPTPTKSPEVKPNTYYYMDGVCLTDAGNNQIKSLNTEHVQARKKRTKRLSTLHEKEAGILASIESVIAGINGDDSLCGLGLMDDDAMNDDDRMDESELYMEGMLWMKEDGPPPEGFTIYTMENGAFVLRRKRQRNLQKVGIGGFLVRVRGIRTFGPDATDDVDTLPGQQIAVQSDPLGPPPSTSAGVDVTTTTRADKGRRKPIRRKPKSKLCETFPLYLQEAFFGREILECGRKEELLQLQGIGGERSSDGSDDDTGAGDKITERKEMMDRDKTIQLSQDELKAVAAVTAKHDQRNDPIIQKHDQQRQQQMLKEEDDIKDLLVPKEEDESDSEFSLAFPKELLGTDIDKLMSEDISELTKDPTLTDDTDMPLGNSSSSKDTKDELSDILGSHFNLPNINSKDVEDIFKGVLTDESQESQESTTTTTTPTSTAYPHLVSNTSVGSNSNSSSATSAASLFASTANTGALSQQNISGSSGGIMGALGRPGNLPGVAPQQVPIQQTAGNLQSPMSFPPQSPYHSEYSNSPQFSPAFSEPPSPWISHHGPGTGSGSTVDPSGSNDFLETTTSSTSLPPSIASSTHNQRSSEKMKADEGLGSGATISAVLYANMNHTEWRTDFPSWSDRYKQIIKKWRTLSTEQKAPYLQQAKDNRAALRIKKQSQGSGVSHPIGSSKADSGSGSVSGPGSTSTAGTGGNGTSTGSGSASASPVAVAVAASAATPSPAAPPTTPSSTPSASPTATLLTTPPPQLSTAGPVGTQLAPQSEDQEKIAQQHKTAREAEQERQWKQLQAMRQQQAQQQQHNIHEQRVQAIVRVQRQLSEGAPPGFMSPEPQSGPIDSASVGSPGAGGPEVNRQLRDLLQFKKLEDQLTPGKANQRVWPPHATENTTGQQDLVDSVGMDQQQQHQQQMDATFRQPLPPGNIGRPRMVAVSAVGPPVGAQAAAAAAAAAAGALRGQGVLGTMRMPMDPRMRLMLQQQQLQRTVLQPQQPQQLAQYQQQQQQSGLVQQQQRFGLPQIQTQLSQTGPRTINAEQYELLQQRNNAMAHQQQFVAQQQQPQLQQTQQRPQLLLGRVGMIQIGQSGVNLQPNQQQQLQQQQQQLVQPQQSQGAIQSGSTSVGSASASSTTDPSANGNDPGEIPDNVTAELEKLEQEGGGEAGDEPGMEEIQGVGDFFGVGDHDDDDELLAEMGADFNILEYADPELDALAGGEKTNILDSLDLVEPEPQQQRQRQENKVQIKKEEPSACQIPQQQQRPLPPPHPPQSQQNSTSIPTTQSNLTSMSNNSVTTSTTSMLTMIKQEHPPPLQPHQHQPTSLPNQQQSPHPQLTAANIQQQSNLPPLPPLTISQPQQHVQVQQLTIQQQQQHLLQQQQQILHQQQQLQQQQHLPQQIPVSVQHQVHQQFLQQLQQAAAAGHPIQAGTKMMLPDGVTGVLLPNNNISISFPPNYNQKILQSKSNNISISFPPNYNQKILQIQQHKIQVRLNQLQLQAAASGGGANTRLQLQPHQQQLLIHHQGALQQQQQQQRLQQLPPPQQQQAPPPPPPPPPYPGPPPPYPGSTNQMMSGGGMPYPPHHPHHLVGMELAQAPLSHHDMIVPPHQSLPSPCPSPSAIASSFYHHGGPSMTPPRSRPMPLLLEEQPLLLEDLLEQEKRELEKQQGVQQQQTSSGNQEVSSTSGGPNTAGNSLLSDHDFERLRADVLNTSPNMLPNSGNNQMINTQQQQPQQRQTFPSANLPPRPPPTPATPQPWQQPPPLRQTAALPQQSSICTDPSAPRPVATFQAHLLAAPPLPPEHIVTEQDRQTQMAYEHWLNHQNAALAQQLKYYETEVQKLRKSKKSLNSKQRQLRKTGGQLTEPDAAELQRISSDQSALQKHLESSRKQSRQHGMLIQEYQTKHTKQLQPAQQPQQSQVQMQHSVQQVAQQQMIPSQQQQSPLGRPTSSPIHQTGMGTPHSPIIHSPSTAATNSVTSPMMLPQQSPMHSPSPHLISHSPGGSVNQHQPPPTQQPTMQSSPGGAHGSITSSPRIGTPLSQQGDNSPVASPGGVGVYLPPPIRMTSPQHRRVVTSPLGYGDGGGVAMRPGTPVAGVVMQARFIRPQLDQAQLQQQQLRMRLQQSPQGPGFQQKPGTPSPLNSPPPQQQQQQQQQQYIQRQLQQQVYHQQQPQQQQQQQQLPPNDEGLAHSQRTQQLIQQRQLIFKQQQLVAQSQQIMPGATHQPAALTPQQHQFMVQQQQQLHKQQVARLAQQQVQGVQQVQAPPSSPMPPQSPLQHQIMSPHSMQQGNNHGSQPASPMPPRSPMVVGAYQQQQQQPPSSPMMPRSPAVAGQIQQMQQQQQQQPPSSPMQMQGGVTSPMMTMMPSPMGHRRPPSVANLSSPAMPERPVSVENPGTPRAPYATPDHIAMDEQQYSSLSQHCVSTAQTATTQSTTNSGGGGNPNNPSTPIPFPSCFGHFGSFKFGLRGGAPPMWPGNAYTIRPTRPQQPTTTEEASSFTVNQSTTVTSSSSSSSNVTSNIPSVSVINITHSGGLKLKKESHRSKVTILKKNSPARTTNMALLAAQVAAGGGGLVGAVPRRMQSLVSMDYNEFDDSSSTPPVTPPPSGSGLSRFLSKTSGKRIPEKPPTPTTISIPEPAKEVLIVESPSSRSGSAGKQQVDDIVDYDDDNDNNLVSTEVTLSDAAQQNDGDDMTVIETFSQSDLANVMSSHLESHQIADDFIFFDMPTSDQYSDKEDADEDYARELEGMEDKDNTHIINVAIQSPTSSEEELILQGKTKQLSMDMVQGLSAEHLLAVSETPDSPEQEELNTDPPDSPETTEETVTPFEDAQIVIVGQAGTGKSLEEQISTKEDFEELIDEGSRKEKLVKHKSQITYTTNPANVFNLNSKQLKSITTAGPSGNIITTSVVRPNVSLIPPKISLIRPPNIVTISKARSDLLAAAQSLKGNTINISSSSLPIKSQVRTMPKLVPTSTHAITIVGASNSQIAQILPSRFTAPVISASVISKLSNANVKLIEKPSSSLSLSTASHQETTLPNKIFEDDSVSPDSSNNEEDKKSDESDTPNKIFETPPPLVKSELTITTVKVVNIETKLLEKQEPKMEILKPITTPSAISHHPPPPELKMTAQIIEDSPPNIASNADVDSMDCGSTDDTKSVVISIPSPTPSQEQYLTNLSLQELENDRREGNRVDGEFESFEDVLDMIENYAGAESSLRESLESNDNLIKAELERADVKEPDKMAVIPSISNHPILTTSTEMPASAITLTTTNRLSVIPQLSPLSQPTELTTNITNVSQQLRTLLSNLQTTSSNTANVIESVVRNSVKEKADPPPPKLIPVMPQPTATISVLTTAVSTSQPMITSTVLMPNKPKVLLLTSNTSPPLGNVGNVSSTLSTPSMSAVVTTSVSNQHPALSSLVAAGRISLTEHPKLAPLSNTVPDVAPAIIATSIPATLTTISMPASNIVSNSIFPGSLATMSSAQIIQQQHRKPLLSLNAMLQSHPAATAAQTSPGTISAASILGSSVAITKASFSTALAQAQPHVVVTSPLNQLAAVTTSILNISTPSAFVSKSTIATSNLLHSQLTKSPIVRPLKPEEEKKDIVPKIEPLEMQDCPITTSTLLKTQDSNKFMQTTPIPSSNRMEDSQNVLLKQLLQNTTCASSQSAVIKTEVLSSTTPPATAPNLPLVPNLEAQLARPVSPIPTSLLPPILQQNEQYNKIVTRAPIMSRETSFVSKPVVRSASPGLIVPPPVVTPTVVPIVALPQTPVVQQLQQSQPQQVPVMQQQSIVPPQQILPNQQLHIDIKKCGPPSRTPSRDEILSPPTPRSSCSQDSSLQTPPLVIKKEIVTNLPTPQQSPIFHPLEVKKEFIDDTSQHSEISDHSKSDIPVKEELDAFIDADRLLHDKEEAKKQKRRMYQQKRRQNQIMKETAAAAAGISTPISTPAPSQPKKRPRKISKIDEDYDSYIESVLNQMRQLPPLNVSEPILTKNFLAVPMYGCGDLSKITSPDFDPRFGDLTGKYGDAALPDYTDYYDTKPYGDLEPLPEKPPVSTQRGFYDQEFPLIRFEENKRFDQFARDDTPDSIVSCSSPEPTLDEQQKPAKSSRFPGLGLINEDDDDVEVDTDGITPQITGNRDRLSPVVPLITPIPIRLKSTAKHVKDLTTDMGKENLEADMAKQHTKNSSAPLKDNAGNVTVTLTLTSSAAEDIMGVLRDLANILQIPAPTAYQIVERTTSPPSQKLGLYRTKGKDGKEGAPIDIQSILNGAAKFCRHCDVVILNNMIKKRFSELPFLSKELATEGDELYFCSSTCYMQFALMHRSPSIPEDKAAAIVDHICQKDPNDPSANSPAVAPAILEKQRMDKLDILLNRRDNYSLFKDIPTVRFDLKRECNLGSQKLSLDREVAVDAKPAKRKSWRGIRYKSYTADCLQPSMKFKRATDKEIMEMMYRLRITVMPTKIPDDSRRCLFCHNLSDAVADGAGRLLNYDADRWIHLNCGLWSDGVYETVNGALMNIPTALKHSLTGTCAHCQRSGATVRCFKTRCGSVYHLGCAVKDGCTFYKNKSVYCGTHIPKGEKENELTTLSVSRRVYVDRDENSQVATVMHHSDLNHLLRVGSLIFLSVGQLLPHQLPQFHTPNYIFPIGYKIIRFYWSMRRISKRCRYICSIHEVHTKPEFRVLVQEPGEEDVEFRGNSCKSVWLNVLDPLAILRREGGCVRIFPRYVSGEDLFGLTEPAVVRVLESLPGIETLSDYKFKYGRNPLLELPLAINPSGAARTEAKLRNQLHWKRPHTQRTTGNSSSPNSTTPTHTANSSSGAIGNNIRSAFLPGVASSSGSSTIGGVSGGTILSGNSIGESICPYSKQFVHSKSSQYKKMKQEWRNNVYLARSKIQGLGLYAARDLEKHTMVIEYIGELIRAELAETRERKYEARNRGIYMFRLDEERVVDASESGGLARYINHSCNPNCVAEIVEVERDLRIIIFAKRRILRGEELAYDYKFDIEDDQHKISCMCGAPNCRKWMN